MTIDEETIRKINARLTALEQFANNVATADRVKTEALQQMIQRVAKLEQAADFMAGAAMEIAKNSDAARTRRAFEKASKVYPKSKSVLFIGRDFFGDNIKYAYLAFMEKAKEEGIECNFLSYSEREYQQMLAAGLPCLPRSTEEWSADIVKTLLRTQIVVVANVLFPYRTRECMPYALLDGAKTVQMWHGIAFKEIGMELIYSLSKYDPPTADGLASTGLFDVFVGSSAATEKDWADKFAFMKYEPTGYPRTDVLIRDIKDGDLLNVDLVAFNSVKTASENGQPVILYTPTFRENTGGGWIDAAQINVFADFCAGKGYLLYVNLHPFEQGTLPSLRAKYPQVNFVSEQTDIYPVLKYVDVLVTDYSSLAFDFLLKDRPIVFYQPGHSEYLQKSRKLTADYETLICGQAIEDIDGLKISTEDAVNALTDNSADKYRDTRKKLRHKFFDHVDGQSSERFCNMITGMLAENNKYVEVSEELKNTLEKLIENAA